MIITSQKDDAFADLPEDVELHPNAGEDAAASMKADLLVVSPGIDTYGSIFKRAFDFQTNCRNRHHLYAYLAN